MAGEINSAAAKEPTGKSGLDHSEVVPTGVRFNGISQSDTTTDSVRAAREFFQAATENKTAVKIPGLELSQGQESTNALLNRVLTPAQPPVKPTFIPEKLSFSLPVTSVVDTTKIPGKESHAITQPPTIVQVDNGEPVHFANFVPKAKELFPKIDSNADGFLSGPELAKAMQSATYKGEEAQVIAALTKHRHELQALSWDERGFQNKGISVADLNVFAKSQNDYITEVQTFLAARDWLERADNFTQVDINKDGFLSARELRKVIPRDDNAESIEYLKTHIGQIEEASDDEYFDENDGITKADLNQYTHHVLHETALAKLPDAILCTLIRTAEGQGKEICMDLYADSNNPINSIKPDVPRQGTVGDCVFISALSALAGSDPQSIKNMIAKNIDGTYTVTFPGFPDEPITVTAPTVQEMGLYNAASRDGSWACVMEKAYGQFRANSFWRRPFFPGDTPQESIQGTEAHVALELLTSRPTDRDIMKWTWTSTTARKLEEAFSVSPPKAVTCSINEAELYGVTTSDGWPMGHAYTVLKFEPDGNGGGIVTVRNPWGAGNNSTRGTKRISLTEFTRNFSNVTYSTKKH